jgi:hypothetical protein
LYKTTPKVNAQLHIPIQKTFKRKYCFEIEKENPIYCLSLAEAALT